MASSSSSRAGVQDIASEIHALVEKCCPKLRSQVEHWLRCYRDPQLLHESLRREYEVEVVDDSDEEETHPGQDKPNQPQPQHFSVPRGDVCKAMLCEAWKDADAEGQIEGSNLSFLQQCIIFSFGERFHFDCKTAQSSSQDSQ
eukprot:symbB.v1.2.021185.t1/scaffold1779.1/size154953/13